LTKDENLPSAAKALANEFNITVKSEPWKPAPHLHPRLELDQRRVAQNTKDGSLFLENAVQMHPDTCLVYLASHELPKGWYRFGGEGHMVEIESVPLTESLNQLFKQPVGDRFALIAPAAWGSKNFSYRFPVDNSQDPQPIWSVLDMMTERPQPHRFLTKSPKHDPRFSRGRYTVPTRTVYVLNREQPISQPWLEWPTEWFPTEGGSYQRWGSGFALPL
jgi:CRISPR-associated protein Cmr3